MGGIICHFPLGSSVFHSPACQSLASGKASSSKSSRRADDDAYAISFYFPSVSYFYPYPGSFHSCLYRKGHACSPGRLLRGHLCLRRARLTLHTPPPAAIKHKPAIRSRCERKKNANRYKPHAAPIPICTIIDGVSGIPVHPLVSFTQVIFSIFTSSNP